MFNKERSSEYTYVYITLIFYLICYMITLITCTPRKGYVMYSPQNRTRVYVPDVRKTSIDTYTATCL